MDVACRKNVTRITPSARKLEIGSFFKVYACHGLAAYSEESETHLCGLVVEVVKWIVVERQSAQHGGASEA